MGGQFDIKKHHQHVRGMFMHDPGIEHYERVYTACTIIPEKKRNPERFKLSILSEGLKNLQDPDYKNYRYKFISRRVYKEPSTGEFLLMAQEAKEIFSTPGFENSYLVAHAIQNGVAQRYNIDELLDLVKVATNSGDWETFTSFSFSIVSKIN